MNNIEILENFINKQKSNKGTFVPTDFEITALENLIQENKELKEARDSLLWQRNFDMKILDEDYIPKLKLKEKFENMRKKHNNLFDIQTLYKEVLEEEWKYDSNNN